MESAARSDCEDLHEDGLTAGTPSKFIFTIIILLCNPPQCVTEPAGLFMTPSVSREPKILPLDRELPVVVATSPQRKANRESWFETDSGCKTFLCKKDFINTAF